MRITLCHVLKDKLTSSSTNVVDQIYVLAEAVLYYRKAFTLIKYSVLVVPYK